MPARVKEPIATWESGDHVTAYALLAKKERRQGRNGDPYLDLVLQDASGSIDGKAWSGSAALEESDGAFEEHGFVAVRGLVNTYKNRLQITVDQCRPVHEEDREHGFDEGALIPTTREDLDDLVKRLEKLMTEDIVSPLLRDLARRALDRHGDALREHPAAKTIHHAYRGGLLEHTVSMGELAVRIADHYPELDRDVLLIGVLFHDLGKLREIGAMPANDYSFEGQLVGHVVIGRDLFLDVCREIEAFPEELRTVIEHLILSHQGRLEFGSPVVPATPEALALHFIDDLDSKLNQLRYAPVGEGEYQYLRGFGRRLFPRNPAGDPDEGS